MAEAATHTKQVKDFMSAEFLMLFIEFFPFECINHTTNRVDNATG